MNHQIKIWPQHYQRVWQGSKTFEIRKNDRAYQKGDTVELRAVEQDSGTYLDVTHFPVLKRKIGDVYPIDAERVVFSLLDLDENL